VAYRFFDKSMATFDRAEPIAGTYLSTGTSWNGFLAAGEGAAAGRMACPAMSPGNRPVLWSGQADTGTWYGVCKRSS